LSSYKKPKIVFSDFDGTLTHGSELKPIFWQLIELLSAQDIELVVVTGRSKSWAHFLLSHFPTIRYVITEGGGVLSGKTRESGRFRLWDKLLVEKEEVERLEGAGRDLTATFPNVEMSIDSFGRETDRAIELSYLSDNPVEADEIKSFLTKHQVNFSTSNVHLNYWCGDLSKMKSIHYFLENHFPDVALEETVFFGDSLNDETAFAGHPHSVGVSNIIKVIDQLKEKPKVILKGEDKEGPFGVLSYLLSLLK
jgi:HAD superfamily hydrolase (TIGR01484 family)